MASAFYHSRPGLLANRNAVTGEKSKPKMEDKPVGSKTGGPIAIPWAEVCEMRRLYEHEYKTARSISIHFNRSHGTVKNIVSYRTRLCR